MTLRIGVGKEIKIRGVGPKVLKTRLGRSPGPFLEIAEGVGRRRCKV